MELQRPPAAELRLARLRELGIEVYQLRPRTASKTAPAVTAATPPRLAAPQAATGAAGIEPGVPRLRLGFAGSGFPGLRAHLLRACAAVESSTEADVLFGGRGKLLALPSLGALAATPALKRQAWGALRVLRRRPA